MTERPRGRRPPASRSASQRGGRDRERPAGDRRSSPARRPPPAGARRPPTVARPDLPIWLVRELERTSRPGRALDAQVALARARAAKERGDEAAVYKAAVSAKQAAPRSPVVRELLGTAAHALGLHREAAQELLAYRRFSGQRELDWLLAETYRSLGRPDRAIEVLEDLDESTVDAPTWVRAQVTRARAYADSGRADLGREILRLAARGRRGPLRELVARALEDL